MNPADIIGGGAQIPLIGRIEHGQILIENRQIFFFKHPAILAKNLVAVLIILTILGNFVDEEQGQSLDTLIVELFLLFKVGKNCLSNLNAAHILFGNIADYITGMDHFAVGKGHGATDGINFRNDVTLVLLHLLGNIEQVITNAQNTGFPVDALIVADFQFNPGHGRLLGGKNNLLQEQILVRTPEIFDLEALAEF